MMKNNVFTLPYAQIIRQWRKFPAVKVILVILLSIIIVAVIAGQPGHHAMIDQPVL